jgi:hypothetical protein
MLHKAVCPECKHDLKAFAELRDSINRSLAKRYAPVKQSSIRQKYQFASIPRGPLSLARVLALIILMLASAVVLWSVLRAKAPEQQLSAGGFAQGESPLPAPALQPPSAPESSPPDTGAKHGGVETRRSSGSRPTASPDRSMSGGRQGIEASLVSKDLVMPPVIEMFDRSPVVARGNEIRSESFAALRPLSTVISEDQPTFRWTACRGATSYTVSVYDANIHLVRTSALLSETRWMPPAPLERGVLYTWIVTALKDGKQLFAPAPPKRAEFKIIEGAKLVELRRQFKDTLSHAARGVILAEAGLLDEAEQELQHHLTLHSTDRHVKKLLETVKSWRSPKPYLPPSPATTKPAQ